ncbi:nucleotide exchange factor GrpE [Candidatus Rariloculus sp.]|uniref:nucleotide exchange factor GrpE n=1 Tax=Candidatus Rariloculus sp. TaxID=3101265 RepID=UPI003D0F0E38
MSEKPADSAVADAAESAAEAPGAGETAADRAQAPESVDAAESAAPGESVEATIDELRQTAEDNWNRYLRAAAEMDNLRRRSARELANAHKFAVERFAAAVLPVRDSIEAALAAADSADAETLLKGERVTLRLLDQALESVSVREIDPHGEPFDPNRHEAMSVLPSADAEPNSVLEVIQKGYAIHNRLIRPARVVVAQDVGGGGDGG